MTKNEPKPAVVSRRPPLAILLNPPQSAGDVRTVNVSTVEGMYTPPRSISVTLSMPASVAAPAT